VRLCRRVDHRRAQEVTALADEPALNREQRRHPEKQLSVDPKAPDNPQQAAHGDSSYAGRPGQDVTHNTSTGAGGATEYSPGNQHHPSRVNSRPPGHGA
jgi:hypothetical protein